MNVIMFDVVSCFGSYRFGFGMMDGQRQTIRRSSTIESLHCITTPKCASVGSTGRITVIGGPHS